MMPTGYTAPLYEGKDISFRDFVLRCSRAMGARITERDNSMDAFEVKLSEPSPYYRDALERDMARRAELAAMPIEEAEAQAEHEYQQRVVEREQSQRQEADMRHRYEAMLTQVQAWEPPTEEHQGLKRFMVEQIADSIKHDCPEDDGIWRRTPERKSGAEWLADQQARVERSIARDAEEWQKEQERTAERNAWLQALDDSLREPSSARG